MTDGKTSSPAQAPSVDASNIPPEIRKLLLPDEVVIWCGRGSGYDRSPFLWIGLVVFLAVGVFGLMQAMKFAAADPPNFSGLVFMPIWLLGAAFFLYRSASGPQHHLNVLTDRQFITIDPRWPVQAQAFDKSGQYGAGFRGLSVHGGPEKGIVAFHGRRVTTFIFGRATGVARPRELAELIKSTLKLDLTIKQRS